MNPIVYRHFQQYCDNSRDNISALESLAYLYGTLRVGSNNVPLSQNRSRKFNKQLILYDGDSSFSSNSSLEENDLVGFEPSLPSIPLDYNDQARFEAHSIGKLDHISVKSIKNYRSTEPIGKFTGKMIQMHQIEYSKFNRDTSFEVIKEGRVIGFIDGENDPSNWVKYISKARNPLEQNIDAVVNDANEIIFYANREIMAGEELFVWYSGKDWFKYLCCSDLCLEDSFFCLDMPLDSKNLSNNTSNQSLQSNNNTSQQNGCQNTSEIFGYECKKCGSLFSEMEYFQRHKSYTPCIDSAGRNFVCEICGRTFEKKERLKVHIRQVHEKIKPYKCEVCSKAFSQSSSLTKHMRTHTGERPYKCTYCFRVCTASSILTTHMRQHTGQRPFRCATCGRDFASHAAHHSHVRRVHKLDPRQTKPQAPLPPNN